MSVAEAGAAGKISRMKLPMKRLADGGLFRLGLLGLWLAAEAAALGAGRPNILFIMTDDHAAHAISAYGSKINVTPNIDRIAKEGVKLNNCFAVNAICTPSRAAILTGKYSHKNGVPVFNSFDGAQPHVAKMLRAAGYQTAMVGKWHLGTDPTGFDYWNILPGQGLYIDPVMIEMGTKTKHKGYVTDIITDFALDYLKKADRSKPFFLMYHHKAPHREWTPNPKHADLYADIDIPEPATLFDDYATRGDAAREAEMTLDQHLRPFDIKNRKPPEGLDPKALRRWYYQQYIKDYLRCVHSVDENVGRVLDYLKESGLEKDTLVIYTSDQGFFLGDHNWYDKRFMYEESLRMPFLARLPGVIEAGSQSSLIGLNVDFAPTFLELAGLPAPGDLQGRSLLPVLKGESPDSWRHSMYYRYYHYPQDHRVQPHWGVRTDTHKLIYFNQLDQWEMYDLTRDPSELNNLYSDPAQAGVVARLKTELKRLRVELDDRDQFAEIALPKR